jgi:hypothetical protein
MNGKRGMRPQDIVILLKIISLKSTPWRTTDLAAQLFMSQSEISQALNRSWFAGLLDETKKRVHKRSFLEFLVHGMKYVYPQKPGAIVRGIPTAHSAAPLSELVQSNDDVYVWSDEDGTSRGEKIEPLYPTVPKAAKADHAFYELMSLVDAIRVGRAREHGIAVKELERRVLSE